MSRDFWECKKGLVETVHFLSFIKMRYFLHQYEKRGSIFSMVSLLTIINLATTRVSPRRVLWNTHHGHQRKPCKVCVVHYASRRDAQIG